MTLSWFTIEDSGGGGGFEPCIPGLCEGGGEEEGEEQAQPPALP